MVDGGLAGLSTGSLIGWMIPPLILLLLVDDLLVALRCDLFSSFFVSCGREEMCL